MDAFNLDIRTMAVMASLASVLQAVALAVLWRTVPQAKGPLQWAAGGAMLALGLLLIAFRDVIPDFLSVVLANTLIVASHAAFLIGIQKYGDMRPSMRGAAIGIAGTAAAFIAFTYIFPSVAYRIVTISAVLTVLACACASQFFKRHRVRLALVEWLLVGLFAIHGLFHAFRATYSGLADHGLTNFMSASVIHGIAFVDLVVFCFIAAIGFSVMTVLAMNKTLESELDGRNALLSLIAHDVRAPFNGLVGASHLVRVNLEEGRTDEIIRFADLLSREAEEALRLLEDLVTWGRSQFSNATTGREKIPLESLAVEVLASFEMDLKEKQLTITTALDGVVVAADRSIVAMALRNFLSNAIKFTPPAGAIAITAKATPASVNLTVTDTGAGLHPDIIRDGPLTTAQLEARALTGASTLRGRTGMGVGLSLCARTCERHGYGLLLKAGRPGGVVAQLTIPTS